MTRIAKLLDRLNAARLDALLICAVPNVRYLSGFSNPDPNVAFAIVGAAGHFLITDYRFGEQARNECRDFQVIVRDRQVQRLGQAVDEIMRTQGITRLGFERDHFLFGLIEDIRADVRCGELLPVSNQVEILRRIKDESEVAAIAQAARIGDTALDKLLGRLHPGMTEKAAARELEYAMFQAGAEDLAFPTILISGERSSMPHGMPSDKPIERGELVTIDFGAVVRGYRSDMTRTLVMGKADKQQRRVYHIIKEAQQAGVDAVRAGIPGKEPYFKVKALLDRCEFAAYAGEGLGHCVGLSLHERPYLEAQCEDLLEEGFVLTVEPGIYIPGWGGVRIEDDVKVTRHGCEVLTHSSKELIELP